MSALTVDTRIEVELPDAGDLHGRVKAVGNGYAILRVFTPAPAGLGDGMTGTVRWTAPHGPVALEGTISPTAHNLELRFAVPGQEGVLQQRQHPRVEVDLPVTLYCRNGDPMLARAFDLSAGGMLVGASEPLVLGQILRFSLSLGAGPPLAGLARVVRGTERGLVAIQFETLPEPTADRLVRYVEQVRVGQGAGAAA